MKKTVKAVVLSSAIAIVLASCASTPKFNQEMYDAAYNSEDYATCAAMLEGKKAGTSAIKNSLDVNMLKYYADDYAGSGKGFVETKQQFQDVTAGMTPAKVMQAALVSENSVEYSGPVYERILSYSMRVVDSIQLDAIDSAVGVMNDYTGTYKDIVETVVNQQKELEEASEGKSDDVEKVLEVYKKAGLSLDLGQFTAPAKYKSSYETSPLMSYLGTVVYAANDDFDHAKDSSLMLKKDNADVDVADTVSVPAGKGRLEVLALSGTVGKREEFATDLVAVGAVYGIPVMFKMTYPQFNAANANHSINAVEVTLSNGETKVASLVEDFDKAVEDDVKSKQAGAYARSLTRNIVKNSVAIGSVVAADITRQKAPNDMAKKIAEAAYTAAIVALPKAMPLIIDAEKADVRQGEYFPHMASAAGFTVDAGTYTVTVKYLAKDNSVVAEKTIENVVVNNGKVSVTVASCAK